MKYNNTRFKIGMIGKALGIANAIKMLKEYGIISMEEELAVGKILENSSMHDVAPLYYLAITMPELIVEFNREWEEWVVSTKYIPPSYSASDSNLLDAVKTLKTIFEEEKRKEKKFYND